MSIDKIQLLKQEFKTLPEDNKNESQYQSQFVGITNALITASQDNWIRQKRPDRKHKYSVPISFVQN